MARFEKSTSIRVAMAVVVLLQFSLATETAWAQAGTLGNIMGKAADETGGGPPGVTGGGTKPRLPRGHVIDRPPSASKYPLAAPPPPRGYRRGFRAQGLPTIS